jgi:hypothetical protein
MKVRELIRILNALDQDLDIFTAIGTSDGVVQIEEVTESCDDPTVIGYMITDDTSDRETAH